MRPWYCTVMAYLPPEVIGLLLALAAFCGVVMMVGLRVRMRGDLEPLSARARWFLAASLVAIAVGSVIVYRLGKHVLDT